MAFCKTTQPDATFNAGLVWQGEHFRFPELHNCALYSDGKGVSLLCCPSHHLRK